MARLDLDRFRKGLQEAHPTTEIPLSTGDVVILRNAMRMPKPDRDRLSAQFKQWREKYGTPDKDDDGVEGEAPKRAADPIEFSEEDLCQHLSEIVEILVGNPVLATRLLSEDMGGEGLPLRNDAVSLNHLLDVHAGTVDLGEASPSRN